MEKSSLQKDKKRPGISKELRQLFDCMSREKDIGLYRTLHWNGREYKMFRLAQEIVLHTEIMGYNVKILVEKTNGSYSVKNVFMKNEKGEYEPTNRVEPMRNTVLPGTLSNAVRSAASQLEPYRCGTAA